MRHRVLFVCTGNIFRSLTAEVALRRLLAGRRDILQGCGETAGWLPDIEDVIPDYQTNRVAVEVHVRRTIDRIVELALQMADNIDALMNRYGTHRNEEDGQ